MKNHNELFQNLHQNFDYCENSNKIFVCNFESVENLKTDLMRGITILEMLQDFAFRNKKGNRAIEKQQLFASFQLLLL